MTVKFKEIENAVSGGAKFEFNKLITDSEERKALQTKIEFVQRHILADAHADSVTAEIERIIKSIEGCHKSAVAVYSLVHKGSLTTNQKMTEDSSRISKGYAETIKALEKAIHNGGKAVIIDGVTIQGCKELNSRLEAVKTEKNNWKKEKCQYEAVTLDRTGFNAFTRLFFKSLTDCKINAYATAYDKRIAKLEKRLTDGKITPDQFAELKAKEDSYK